MRMPEVLANASEAIISRWLVDEGVAIKPGQPLAEAKIEKKLVEVLAEIEGILGRKLINEGASIAIGAPIAVMMTTGETAADIEEVLASNNVLSPNTFSVTSVKEETIHGTSPGGRIVKRDIQASISEIERPIRVEFTPVIVSQTDGSYLAIPHTRMRRAIARRLTESKSTTPHFYLSAPCIVDALLSTRKQLNERSERKVSVTDLILKTVAAAFSDVPNANVIWTADELHKFKDVDISIAVATEKGLITPIVRAVNKLNLDQLSSATEDLIARARSGKLTLSDIEGGSFSVTNLGMYGTDEFFAILNPPQSVILAVGAAKQKPVIVNGSIAIASVINFTLSVDHRAIDGALAAEWLAAFVKRIENPMWLVR